MKIILILNRNSKRKFLKNLKKGRINLEIIRKIIKKRKIK